MIIPTEVTTLNIHAAASAAAFSSALLVGAIIMLYSEKWPPQSSYPSASIKKSIHICKKFKIPAHSATNLRQEKKKKTTCSIENKNHNRKGAVSVFYETILFLVIDFR